MTIITYHINIVVVLKLSTLYHIKILTLLTTSYLIIYYISFFAAQQHTQYWQQDKPLQSDLAAISTGRVQPTSCPEQLCIHTISQKKNKTTMPPSLHPWPTKQFSSFGTKREPQTHTHTHTHTHIHMAG